MKGVRQEETLSMVTKQKLQHQNKLAQTSINKTENFMSKLMRKKMEICEIMTKEKRYVKCLCLCFGLKIFNEEAYLTFE